MNKFSSILKNLSTELYTPMDLYMPTVAHFVDNSKGHVYASKFNFKYEGTFFEVTHKIEEMIKSFDADAKVSINAFNPQSGYIFYDRSNSRFDQTGGLVYIDYIQNEYRKKQSSFRKDIFELELKIHGSSEFVEFLEKNIPIFIKESNIRTLTWCYVSEGRAMSKDITLENEYKVYDEYYPFLKTTLNNYFNEYMKSSAPILLLIGEPGTGKTSFTRELIFKKKLAPIVTYDEGLMQSDGFYLDYLTTQENDLMIIEDADKLLLAREKDNSAMSKILNLSDGLVKLKKKKIIVTTNIVDINLIDEALMRPGRCFDKIEFNKLTTEEAQKVADKAKIKLTGNKKFYTLAEIFNPELQDDDNNVIQIGKKTQGMGFFVNKA